MEHDKWSSIVWLGLSILICAGSLRLSLGTLRNPGPGFLPFFAGLIVGVLALVVHVQARRAERSGGAKTSLWPDRRRTVKVVLTACALVVYAVGMNYVGFLASTVVFLAFLLRVIEPRRWSTVVLTSLLASVAFYVVFEIGLRMQLPKGPFDVF